MTKILIILLSFTFGSIVIPEEVTDTLRYFELAEEISTSDCDSYRIETEPYAVYEDLVMPEVITEPMTFTLNLIEKGMKIAVYKEGVDTALYVTKIKLKDVIWQSQVDAAEVKAQEFIDKICKRNHLQL